MTEALDTGTYEVLRARLAEQAKELARRAEALNARRLEIFGSTELRLIGTERLRTEHNCVPRDIVTAGDDTLLFGFNVFIGLKPVTTPDDVFATYRFSRDGDGFAFEPATGDFLRDERFTKDFAELYRYYRGTRLLQLRRPEAKLLAAFQTGLEATDAMAFRWQVNGAVTYLDNQGAPDNTFPPPHDFEWIPTTRDDHVLGRHPHISIEGEVFVETVGGDLTVKIENNTETGQGIYAEPVAEPLQSLADAEVHYARVGSLILLRVLPYKEETWRHLVFNTRTKAVVRLDGIGRSCRRLPEDHGLIFPGGYYLATGAVKTFDTETGDLEYEEVIRSINGEDVLYVFHARDAGRYLLLPYNLIRKEVATPIVCHGHALFDDGTLVLFRADSAEPTRVHPMQVWQTPFLSEAYAATLPAGTGPLERVGNKDLVRGISDALTVAGMVADMAPSGPVFEALIAAATRVFDHYHWLADPELEALGAPLGEVRATAEQVLDEFEKVRALTAQAASAVSEAATRIAALVRLTRGEPPATADAWVARLADLRRAQGRLVTLREMRYADLARIDTLDAELETELGDAARRAVTFLQGPDAFDHYRSSVATLESSGAAIATVAEAAPISERLAEETSGLELVTEIVGSLDIADATVRTAILERIAEVLGAVNRARATLDARRRELLAVEGRAAFAAEFALLGQAVTAALAMTATPDACDEQLGRLMLQVENLEQRFGEFEDFAADLAAKREDVYEAFSARKQTLLDERARATDRLAASADRILAGLPRRVARLGSLDEVNAYFAADPMVAKLRSVVAQLRELGDPVRAEELEGRIKAARQEAGRTLRDQVDLFEGETIRLGRHRFAVNRQPLELTLVPYGDGMAFALTGTDFRTPVTDPAFAATRPFWSQALISETAEVYRAEHLAASLLAEEGRLPALYDASPAELAALVTAAAQDRYEEGYERGVHDTDATTILAAVLPAHRAAGLLRHPPSARAAARLFWAYGTDEPTRTAWTTRAISLIRARTRFGPTPALKALQSELTQAITTFHSDLNPGGAEVFRAAGEYLVEELALGRGFASSAGARALLAGFERALGEAGQADFRRDLDALGDDLAARHQLAAAWLGAYAESTATGALGGAADVAEAVVLVLCGDERRYDVEVSLEVVAEGLLGAHPRVRERRLELRIDEFLARTREFRDARMPAYRAYQRQRSALVARERERLRLSEYEPRVMSAFVRNRLLDEVYLPLIGDNLAKQLGAAGDAKRTDQNGLLLLVSPPGYGKTTLMEYVANRLGLVFVKVNGPAIGAEVTSLDPAEARNATARQEIEKISFALELGNNVLLYLDDVQHTSPELLQKFISLCDAQRRIEGVWDGRTRTYDLRGKRFAVCMAANPYTESGGRFQIPDMLANRADVWNLGEVLSGREDLFALSYLENALTANPVLAPLSTRERSDVELLARLAAGDSGVAADRLAHPYSPVELEQILAVLRKLLEVRRVVLAANRAYIASAAQADASRTEPPFQLQGSYRDMNKLAERIVPVMNEAELAAVVDDHYLAEAQTLAGGAEANLLKLGELRGSLTDGQRARWVEVKAAYLRAKALGGAGDDPADRAVGALGLLADRMSAVQAAIDRLSRP